jgi:uncharacterized membrane protein YoaK (UPF0700 family)
MSIRKKMTVSDERKGFCIMNLAFHEKRTIGLLLTFIGGAMDSYTYIHYESFASAQTGNLVLAVIQAFDGEWLSVGKKLLSTLFFFFGIILAKYLIQYFAARRFYYWRLYVLFYEAIVFLVVGFHVLNIHPALVTIMISFTAAIQWISFDKINGRAYTNLFTTGNLKGVSTNFYDFFIAHKEEAKEPLKHYSMVVAAFLSGAIVSVALYHLIGSHSIQFVSVILILMAIVESIQTWSFTRKQESMKEATKTKII